MRRLLRLSLPACAVLTAVPLTVLTAAPASAAPSGLPKAVRKATVVRIVDGDTIEVRLRKDGPVVRVRFLGPDTPERGRCWFEAATERTRRLLPVGKAVYLLRDEDVKDHYGRRLFYVWNREGVSVSRNLIRHGFAKALLYRSNDRYIRVMRTEQAKARDKGLRIWSGRCDAFS
ncbi:thermonuclease family protein [Planomonospora sp. ID67723]|uniref:thermonuclease family protein n=1 Tax=Planomonospora sp. ID67723 TaxID=2738134 RepID=UPI0018C42E98|nr:thermonuclease family protein [Planomonospora sp. ID67723]MBG0830677.1 thermonuclease family protein [Planomonospora sp. ID67723]